MPWGPVEEFEEDISIMVDQVRQDQVTGKDARSLALVITHLEDAALRYRYAFRHTS